MRVDRAAPRCQEGSAGGGVHYERGRSVFVGNLPFDVEVRSLPLHVLPGARFPEDLQTHISASVLGDLASKCGGDRGCSCVQDLLQCMSFILAKGQRGQHLAQLHSRQILVERTAPYLCCSTALSCTPSCLRCHHNLPSSGCTLPAAICTGRLSVQLCSYKDGLGPHSSPFCRTEIVLALPEDTQSSPLREITVLSCCSGVGSQLSSASQPLKSAACSL